MIIGHDEVREHLERDLPPVTLLLGPASVGKMTLARYLVAHHGGTEASTLSFDGLRVDDARQVRVFASVRPTTRHKFVVARIDRATEEAMNALLKVLEEPPPYLRVILTASRRPMLTIESRAHVVRLGLLRPEEVRDVLVNQGILVSEAERLSKGRGTISAALAERDSDSERSDVRSFVRALSVGDEHLASLVVPKFDEKRIALLGRWSLEARTRRWSVFAEAEAFGLQGQPAVLDAVDAALRIGARPTITARLVASTAMTRREQGGRQVGVR